MDPQNRIVTFHTKTIWSGVSNVFQIIHIAIQSQERYCDPKISETRLAVRGNQDVVLGIVSNQRVGSHISLVAYRSDIAV